MNCPAWNRVVLWLALGQSLFSAPASVANFANPRNHLSRHISAHLPSPAASEANRHAKPTDGLGRATQTHLPGDQELRDCRRMGTALLALIAIYWIWEQSVRARRRSVDFPYMDVKMIWRTPRRKGVEKRNGR